MSRAPVRSAAKPGTSGVSRFGYRPAVQAVFDAPSQHRRSLIAKVKIAQKELGIGDDDYRAIVLDVSNSKTSAKDCSEAELIAILDRFKSRGWQAKPAKQPSKAADHKAAMKARAMWISLGHLGAISDPSERALEAFGRRQLKCERLQWADQGQMFKLIEALKAMAERNGWDQSTKNATDGSHAVWILKHRLCAAILLKLKAAGYAAEAWNLAGAAINIAGFEKARTCGPNGWTQQDFDMLAKVFGKLLATGQRGE